MSELLFNRVQVESAKRNKGVEFTDSEKALVKQVVLEEIERFGGVPFHTVDKKEVVDGGKFVPAIKKACLEAGEVPEIYAEKGRSWASYAYLAGAVVRGLIADANKAKAKQAKEVA
jgi:diaminopimelate decarboxylase